jgi:hypothetical protein
MIIVNTLMVNKTNNSLSPQIIEHKKWPQHVMLDVIGLRQAQKCGRVNVVNRIWIYLFS